MSYIGRVIDTDNTFVLDTPRLAGSMPNPDGGKDITWEAGTISEILSIPDLLANGVADFERIKQVIEIPYIDKAGQKASVKVAKIFQD